MLQVLFASVSSCFKDDVDVLRDAEIGDLLIYQVVLCSSDGRTVSFRAKLLEDALALIM